MNQFNNIRFIVPANDDNPDADWEYFDYAWNDSGNQVEFNEATHGRFQFKNKTSKYEFLMCPVNPQQTYWKYVKINKKAMDINDITSLIEHFYSTNIKIEQILDIPDDQAHTIEYVRTHCEKQSFTWGHLLGPNRKFNQIVESKLNGFKTYQLVFSPVN